MKVETDAKLVTIYVSSTEQWHGRPLYSAIVQLCEERGIAGATVTRCLEGYGAGGHVPEGHRLRMSAHVPIRVEIVDIPERIGPLLTALEGMLREGLVTVRDVHVLRLLPDPRP
jgi:PII-like signaling protein